MEFLNRCNHCRNVKSTDKKLFTNTWIGFRPFVSKTYLTYRWSLCLMTSIFLLDSIYRRIFRDGDGEYWLYLTSWVRILAFLNTSIEAVLVTARWRTEFRGEEVAVSDSYAVSTVSPLPISHRALWLVANTSANVSLLTTCIYWPFFYQHGVHPLDMQNLSGHGLITFMNIVDIFISNRPWRCLHVYQSQLFCLAYALSNFAYLEERGHAIYHSHYLYSVLDWSKPSQCMLTIFGFGLLLPFIHMFFIILFKTRCAIRKCAQRRSSSPDDVMELGR